MGTNYYLIKKCNREEFNRHNKYNDDFMSGDQFEELTNGYVYRDTYYPNEEELEKELSLTLHIGKSSHGWHFSLCVYPELSINNLDDWKKLFAKYEIYDEYRDLLSADEMINTITNRSNKDFLKLGQEEFERQVLLDHNKLQHEKYKSNGFPAPVYFSYENYLRDMNAERGLNGLIAHKGPWFTRTNGTYDLTERYNFS